MFRNDQRVIADVAPTKDDFLAHVLEGLQKPEKAISSKFLYDERGSEIFEQICDTEDYYPTRTEMSILETRGSEMAHLLGDQCAVIEPGSGSGAKARMLLDRLEDPVAYVPIEISPEYLARSAEELASNYDDIEVLPVCADFTQPLELPTPDREPARNVVFFPGGTIGNLHPREATTFLERFRELCGDGGAVIIGVDLEKDPLVIERAYNDREGVTAEFNLNLIDRMNRELDADFDRDAFRHRAIYDEERARIEMHLVSEEEQVVRLGDETIEFDEGEPIITEYSYKYSPDRFRSVARRAGLDVARLWTDEDRLFSVQLCLPAREVDRTGQGQDPAWVESGPAI